MLTNREMNIFDDYLEIINIGRALSSPQRIQILQLLSKSSLNVQELAKKINSPLSTTSLNVTILEEVGFVVSEKTNSNLGKIRLVGRSIEQLTFIFLDNETQKNNYQRFNIPIGSYVNYNIEAGCGIATFEHTIGMDNDENIFFHPERYKAGLIWFKAGFLEYRISLKQIPRKISQIIISFETCSEAQYFRNDWKSDITIWLNDIEIGTYTSPGDFGGRKGQNNPEWWSNDLTQFGILTNWSITENGSTLNNEFISNVKLSDLNLKKQNYISLKIGVKKDSHYVGGINIFGSSFGDYNQDIYLDIFE
ncbi:MAG: helix-turn-helix domain-containing protein [Bacillales bacterium]|jgi:predicted transcriptional regulator|nr:helix-turn-helix domain-containing protein [Bacillales bacterium]